MMVTDNFLVHDFVSDGCKLKQVRKKKRKCHQSFIVILIVLSLQIQGFFCSELNAVPLSTRINALLESNVSLACSASIKPILCLWKTPYGHVYTLSEGVFAESGRLRHEQPHDGVGQGCGLQIRGVESRDAGDWQCEVGAIVRDAFETDTATIAVDVKRKSDFNLTGHTSRQEVGNDVILHCSSEQEVHLCRWKTPYLNTYIVGEGIYVERGRIQWLGKDPNHDCTIRVAKLDLRDAGTWVCELGSSTTETFQVQTKEFVIDIETPLKLSAPTSLMQNANTDATLVCHANKPYDDCLWTTPYGVTYSFSSQNASHENGRIAYFGFAPTDCGVIVHNVASKDNGDWLCQLHSTNGDIFQNATDIVPLYADLATAAKPRAIPDYDYDKKIGQYEDDYSDYGDFSKVGSKASPSQQAPPTRIQLVESGPVKTSKPRPSTFSTTEHGISDLELTKLPTSTHRLSQSTDSASTSTPRTSSTTTTQRFPSSTSPASSTSIFRDDGIKLSGVNALELELLSRISGTRRDSRPVSLLSDQGSPDGSELVEEFESSRTEVPTGEGSHTEKSTIETTTTDSRDGMRQREIHRIRDERRKSALQRGKDELDSGEKVTDDPDSEDAKRVASDEAEKQKQKLKQELEAERLRQMAIAREEEKRRQLERQKQVEDQQQKLKEEDDRRRQFEVERRRTEERQKQLEEERKQKEKEKQEAEEKKKKEEEEKKRKEEEEEQKKLKAKEEEEKKRKEKEEEEERKKKEMEELERKKKAKEEEERKQKAAEEEEKRKKLEEERRKKLEEEERLKVQQEKEAKEKEEQRVRQVKAEEERKRVQEIERRRLEERQKQLELQRKREEEKQKQKEEEEKKRKEEEERKKKEEKEREERLEAERKEEAERLKIEAEQKRIREEQKRRREEELRTRLENERKRKLEEERRQVEVERKRQEERERIRLEEEAKKKVEEEKLLKEIEEKKREQEEQEKKEAAIKKKEEEERRKLREETSRREEERRRRLEAQQKREEADKAKKLEEERLKKLQEDQERVKEVERQKQKQEEAIKLQREEERLKIAERKREEEKQRELQQRKLDQVQTNKDNDDQVSKQTDERPQEDTGRSLQSGQQLTNLLPEKGRENERKHCVLPAFPSNGNVTCGNLSPEGDEFRLIYGQSCILTCKAGYVSLELRESRCFNGRMTQRLECVPPDALLIVGGRSDTYGVLSSVELVTGRGVCRGAVPPLPTMRWRMIAHAIDRERVLACGGVNIFGDPKADCWIMGFNPEPFWSEASSMNIARDAAAWAQEGNFLFVLGGSLGKFSGYTDSVEMYSVETGTWLEGPKMSSSRYSHCAVGLGNGSLIVTGGYGGPHMVERLDVAEANWVSLPELNPVRAQHGCALVDLYGEQGVIVVGGDSGGTRLKDVRFLPIKPTHTEWKKVADMLTARWGRPGVGIVGGRITVAAGWNGVKDLDTVEYYDEVKREWKRQASRLQTERRWPSSTPISLFLFPKCAQRRE